MAKRKRTSSKKTPAKTLTITPLLLEILVRTVTRSPHLNRADKANLLAALKKLKG